MARRPTDADRARALISRLGEAAAALQGRELIAPLLPGGRIRTRIDGLVYEFVPSAGFAGWGRFRPRDERTAEPLGEALPWQRAAYLERFPPLRLILLWPDERRPRAGAWWALPYNESDARQRFGLPAGEPLPVYLCDPFAGADRFERVIARVDGRTLWFDSSDPLADASHADLLRDAAAGDEPPERLPAGLAGSERQALLHHVLRSAEQEVRRLGRAEQLAWLRRTRAQGRLEGRLRHALHKAGATLLRYEEVLAPDGTLDTILVEWSEHGHSARYRVTVDPNLTVVSSGICLSGRDRDFDLTSLVDVVRDT